MIKARIKTFEIEKDFDSVTFKPLINIGIKEYDEKIKKYKWSFPIENLKEVQRVIGVGLEFSKEEVEMVNELCPALKEIISLPKFKGKSTISVIEFPKIFRVLTSRKVEDEEGDIKIEPQKYDVNKELVKTIFDNIITKYPKFKRIKPSTTISKICDLLGIKRDTNDLRLLRDTKNYSIYYYPVLKILQYYGYINYHLNGDCERIKDGPFAYQTHFEVIEG